MQAPWLALLAASAEGLDVVVPAKVSNEGVREWVGPKAGQQLPNRKCLMSHFLM